MSHSREEEEIEQFKSFLDDVDILNNNINTIKNSLQRATSETSRSKLVQYCDSIDSELRAMEKRVSFMRRDLSRDIK